jgi:hypothetical protein
MNSENRVELWRHYEDVAMHFNDLLIHLRSQALGAVSVIITGAGLFVGHQAAAQDAGRGTLVSWPASAAISLLLFVAWTTLMIIDVFYYSRLLRGAVNALLKIEEESNGEIRLSTEIESMFGNARARKSLNWPMKFFYVPILLLLGVFTAVSIYHWYRG